MKKVPKIILHILNKIHPIEIIIAISIVGFINYFTFINDPGFLNTHFNPYFITILFFSIFYGKYSGILTFLLSLVSMTFIYFFNHLYVKANSIHTLALSVEQLSSISFFFFIGFISSIVFGEVRDTLGTVISRLKSDKNELIQKNKKLIKENEALQMVNEEYQDRILGQQNSLISLYSVMISLNSLDLKAIYPNVLDAVIRFTGATKCSIWQYNHDSHSLKLLSNQGWDDSIQFEETLSDVDTIIGWVARNNVFFSIKMLGKYKNLREIDKNVNIITVPITIESRVWGVINIEDIPFIKYNLYSEQLLLMIAELASPVIANAIRFTSITKKDEIDPVTGLHSLDQLFIIMKDEFDNARAEKNLFSFVIAEVANYIELLDKHTEQEVLQVLKQATQMVLQVSIGKAMLFQYKGTFQFAIVIPSMDHDGAALLCLNIIEEHYKKRYFIKDEQVFPELILGYSSLRENHRNEEDLMLLAENLLEMQKI